MRLRSTQFVFLLLLACSVQMQGVCAAQLLAEAVGVRTAAQNTRRETAPAIAPAYRSTPRLERPVASNGLNAAATAAHRVAWGVRGPARESSAVISFTGFLRA